MLSVPLVEKRIANFENLAFGIFVHWGLYSQIGRGEWIMDYEGMDESQYSKYIESFTAEDFSAKALVKVAKRAGAKYITLTARHHEGFSLFDTCGLSEYDSIHSPAKRDLIKEFVEACNNENIMPIFYHTTLDWHHTDFKNNFNAYLTYLRKSVEVLCTKYGKIGGFWFDGNWSKPEGTDWLEDELYSTIRKYQPEAMIINNTGLTELGKIGHKELDCVTFEQHAPCAIDFDATSKYVSSEMCQTINSHWGYAKRDFNNKSTVEIIETLCMARKNKANYLLNIGLTAQGGMSNIQIATLEAIGDWIDLCGEGIYGGKPSDAVCDGKDFVLDDGNHSYIFVYDLKVGGSKNVMTGGNMGDKRRLISNMDRKVSKIEWLDNGEELEFTQPDNSLLYTTTQFPYGTNTVVRVAKITYK